MFEIRAKIEMPDDVDAKHVGDTLKELYGSQLLEIEVIKS